MRVVLLKGQSGYAALRLFVDELAPAFAARGFEPVVIDAAATPDLSAELRRAAAAGPVALAFSFNILGEWRDAGGRSIGELVGAPHVLQLVDYPLSCWHRLDGADPKTALLVVDPTHVRAITETYGPGRFAHVGFSPHGAVGRPVPAETDAAAFAEARPIPMLFAGTFYKPEGKPGEGLEPGVRRIVLDALDLALSREWIAPLDALDTAMRAAHLDPAEPGFAGFRKIATHIHEHVRSHRRFELLKAAAKAGLPLHVYGAGYERQLYRFKTVTFGGQADLSEIAGLMARSRVVLNANANFGAGSHERPLSAMLAGAVAATDHSAFYAERFVEGREIALYRWNSLGEDLAKLAELARDPERAFAMARAGHAKALAGHRWEHRVDAILAAADATPAPLPLAA